VPRAYDVMVVVDVSHSMQEQFPGGPTKLAAAQDGVAALLDALRAEGLQAGLVTFSETAEVRRPLSPDVPGVVSALRGVRTAPGTAIEAGLALARRELTGPRRLVTSRGIIVLLTDGRSHPAPASAAIAEAAAARSAGIQVWSIGIGPEVDARTLRQVAGLDTRFHHAQRADELASAFLAVEQGLKCRTG
jgi:Mg-chelatase subunit ChlD